ncbi:MAG: biopolymer transporter ExbD [Prosthecobacter sp.]|uniref:ExbD/TolR family protein n=1 Tax=Prosthecobacter sp. TaxID=1965333 RepID=UPI0026392BB7|nr:biopolymer transporter ExbD [Prosthecobacter sp.]MCF7790235.1 biopolymer transporter ExbD [Prosthecobacter sp.]
MSVPGKKKHHEIATEELAVGFQIAPMIDVVFVIMLFFMVMVGSVKVERELKSQLPGLAPPSDSAPQEMPDEIIVGVEETGAVTLNEEEFDSGRPDKALPDFISTLKRLKEEADNRSAKVIVTIQAEEQATYERVIDVLNALSVAKIANVTFTVGGDEGF